MKHLSRFLLVTILVLGCTTVQAQDENNPWVIGIGVNAVDSYPANEDNKFDLAGEKYVYVTEIHRGGVS